MNPFKWLWNKITTEKYNFDAEQTGGKDAVDAVESYLVIKDLKLAKAHLEGVKLEISEANAELVKAREELTEIIRAKAEQKLPPAETKVIKEISKRLTGGRKQEFMEEAKKTAVLLPEGVVDAINSKIEKQLNAVQHIAPPATPYNDEERKKKPLEPWPGTPEVKKEEAPVVEEPVKKARKPRKKKGE